MILLAGRTVGEPELLALLIVLLALSIGSCLAVFLMAERVSHLLGITGNVVLTRLLGVLLAALAVQFVIDGLAAGLVGRIG
jgi:multiple antibiotic resistance protein